jgi:hypothetical protein
MNSLLLTPYECFREAYKRMAREAATALRAARAAPIYENRRREAAERRRT